MRLENYYSSNLSGVKVAYRSFGSLFTEKYKAITTSCCFAKIQFIICQIIKPSG